MKGNLKMEISACVFDFGGVMTPALNPDLVKPIAESQGLDWNKIVEGYKKHRRLMDGDFISLREMYQRIFIDMNASVDKDAFEKILEADTESFLFRNEETLSFMNKVRKMNFSIGILTNMSIPFSKRFREVFADYIALADAVVVSGEEKLFKPMREIYDLTAHRLGVQPGKICFFDDIEENCEAARAAGWSAIRFISAEDAERKFLSKVDICK